MGNNKGINSVPIAKQCFNDKKLMLSYLKAI